MVFYFVKLTTKDTCNTEEKGAHLLFMNHNNPNRKRNISGNILSADEHRRADLMGQTLEELIL